MGKDDGNPATDGMKVDGNLQKIDFEQVTRLIEALEQDLKKLKGDSPDIQHLRDEVETLKNVLKSPVRRHHWVTDALHGIRERVDDALEAALAEGIQVGRYVAEIGRILGM
jgi:archaellum component FlaC